MENSNKKNTASLFLLLCFLVVLLAGCKGKNSQKEVSEALGINVESGTEISYSDTHGGFHGDGTKYIEYSFSDETVLNAIKQSSQWKQLPLNTELNILIYGIGNDTETVGPYVTNSNGMALFPTVENGYYFFKDRFSSSTENNNSVDILNRHAFNFTFAIYDSDANVLYFCEFDT